MTTPQQQVITMNATPAKPTGSGYTYPRPRAATVSSVRASKSATTSTTVRPAIRAAKVTKKAR